MTAPLFLVARGTLDQVEPGSTVRLDGAEGRHAVQVRRIGVGERVALADGAGHRVEGIVTAVEGPAKSAGLVVQVSTRSYDVEPAPRFVLVQALAKGDRDVTAIEAATELGVDVIIPWQAERSVVVWRADRAEKSRSRWAATVLAASKQSRRTRVPPVSEVCSTADIEVLARASSLTLVLHEEATTPLPGVPVPDHGDVVVVVGPEGGLSGAELDRFLAAGAVAVRLGAGVLRSSTAGPAALAVLSARSRWA